MSSNLYRFAKLLELKYLTKHAMDAENMRSQIVEHIKQMLINAASRAPALGIINFPQMVAQDQTVLTFDITKNGKNITNISVSTSNPDLTAKYKPLETQVKNYLEKNWELFPTQSNGDSVDYDNFNFKLMYGEEPGVAAR